MSHPRIEEVSDSDDAASDPSEGDIADFADADILRQKQQPVPASSSSAAAAARTTALHPPAAAAAGARSSPYATAAEAKAWASFRVLYPVYFDAGRSRAQGRRVPAALAVRNPLARQMVDACAALGLRVLFEPSKTHPKDWANPGRVKVDLRGQRGGGGTGLARVKNKHHLYILVARHLQAHPVSEDSAVLREAVGGAPPPPGGDEAYPRPAVPRGWKVGELLPYYSPALGGGGVSENYMQDIMRQMQGGGGGDMAGLLQGAGGGGGSGSAGGGGGGGDGGGAKKKKGKGKAKA